MQLNKYIDHTLLKSDAQRSEIELLCKEAIKYQFASVCVNGYWVKLCSELLKNTDVNVCCVVGFPLGANTTKIKALETKDAITNGANEIDMVMNIGALKASDYQTVLADMLAVVEAANGRLVKVILETCLLSETEIRKACQICIEAKVHFVKTSTGFSNAGASVEVVKIMKETVKDQLGIKASGCIRDLDGFLKMLEVGATRIGTSGAIEILEGDTHEKY